MSADRGVASVPAFSVAPIRKQHSHRMTWGTKCDFVRCVTNYKGTPQGHASCATFKCRRILRRSPSKRGHRNFALADNPPSLAVPIEALRARAIKRGASRLTEKPFMKRYSMLLAGAI